VSLNRTARGIVLVPSLLLGGAFLAAAAWGGEGAAAENRPLALGIGAVLMGAGLLTQLLPVAGPTAPAGDDNGDDEDDDAAP
jgi:hypothetical protein